MQKLSQVQNYFKLYSRSEARLKFFFTFLAYKQTVFKVERIAWGYYSFILHKQRLYASYKLTLRSLYGTENFYRFQHDKNFYITALINRRRLTKVVSRYRRRLQVGAIVLRATLNNFFITFLKQTRRGEVGLYMSAGIKEHGVARRRTSLFVTKKLGLSFIKKLKVEYPKVKRLFIFISRVATKRINLIFRLLQRSKYKIMALVQKDGVPHNHIRPRKRRRIKDWN